MDKERDGSNVYAWTVWMLLYGMVFELFFVSILLICLSRMTAVIVVDSREVKAP